MPDHDHAGLVAMLGECPVCAVAEHHAPEEADPRGETFQPTADRERLGLQARRVLTVMADGEWHTLAEIAHLAASPEASVSARLRDLRRPELGGYTINGRRRAGKGGLWEYQMQLPAVSPGPAP